MVLNIITFFHCWTYSHGFWNKEIHIISSAQETPATTFRPITDNPTQAIFLGHIAHFHYVSTRSVSEPQEMQYGGCTKDGVRLIKTYIINNILT